jgi:dipeptidyl aminopeptidase/acylaminoacyl peptidase
MALTGVEANLEHPLFAIETIYTFEDGDTNILMLDRNDSSGVDRLYPNVIKVNTVSGFYDTVVENPGTVVRWGVDHTGCVRLGFTATDKLETGFIYRENEKAPWHALAQPKGVLGQIRPLGFDYSTQKLYVAALSSKGHWAIYPFDPATGALGDALMENPDYDVVLGEGLVPAIDGIALNQPIFSEQKQRLVGVYYLTEGPRMRWFDPDFAADQHAINKALPNTINLITSRTRDEKRMLVLAFSDRDPGTYYLFDTTEQTLTRIGARMGWIKPELMASMYPIKYKARDGQSIHGYVTLPPGRGRISP